MSKKIKQEYVKYSDKYANEPDIPFFRDPEFRRMPILGVICENGRISLNYMPAVDDPDKDPIETAEISHHTYEIEYWRGVQKTKTPKISAVFDSFEELEEFSLQLIKACCEIRREFQSVGERSGNDGETIK